MTKSRTNADNVTADIAGITAGTGITGGGTSGTVTITNSMATAFDTKGDLIAATAADTFSKLAVGANDTVLTAASGEATGLKWATASSFLPTIFETTATRYIGAIGTVSSIYLPTINITRYIPIFIPVTLSFDRISIRTNQDYAGTSTVRLGVYNCDTATGKPSTVKFDAGTVNASVVNTTYEITISQTLTPGYYFLAFNQQANTDDGHYWTGLTAANNKQLYLLNTRGSVSGVNTAGYTESGITGAFATAGTVSATDSIPSVALRIV